MKLRMLQCLKDGVSNTRILVFALLPVRTIHKNSSQPLERAGKDWLKVRQNKGVLLALLQPS